MHVRPSPYRTQPALSVVICTTRPACYAALLQSLAEQTEPNYEVITIDDRAPLTWCRNQGLSVARGAVVSVIDDDTLLPPGWVAGVLGAFQRHPHALGVSGPAIIPASHRANRQLFRYHLLHTWYAHLFLDGNRVPGHICRSGAPTTCSANESCTYEG